MSRGLLGKASKIQMRQCRKDALKEADVVILAGIKNKTIIHRLILLIQKNIYNY